MMDTNKMTRLLGKAGLKFKKHAPEIMVVAGCVGVVTSAVMACKATTKVHDIVDNHKTQVTKIKKAEERLNAGETVKLVTGEDYTTEDVKRDLICTYRDTGIEMAKIYGPSVLLGTLSIASILAGHNITRKRNLALAAAYTVVDTGFKEYRKNVVDRFGKEMDKELRYNIKAEEVEETIIDENGEEIKTKTTIQTATKPVDNDFSKFFDEGCYGWTKDPELNKQFLLLQQSYANDKLKRDGRLFLNDVYKMLGIDITRAGQEVGWIYDESPDHMGDNYVDFGIFDIHRSSSRQFVNGRERSILLDFNVDGYILDRV